jgi:hypothetical protein
VRLRNGWLGALTYWSATVAFCKGPPQFDGARDGSFDWQTLAGSAGFFAWEPALCNFCRTIRAGERFEFPANLRSRSMQNAGFGNSREYRH